MNNFHYALSLAETLYGVSMQDDQFEEIALVGWGLIGNKRSKLYRYTTCLNFCERELELPCNCDILEAVTTDWEDFQHVDNMSEYDKKGSFDTEQYIEHNKAFKRPDYASGKFVIYERVGNTLYFNQPYNKINILYRGLVLDDDGLPEITDKEAEALATYVAYVSKYKEGLVTNNANILQLAQMLKQDWLTKCDQARTDFQWTQNDYDEILDAKTNWDRKLQSRSYKLIR